MPQHVRMRSRAIGDTWLSMPVNTHVGSFSEIKKYVPKFYRQSFAVTHPGMRCSGLNAYMDAIVRTPLATDKDITNVIPVGIVSKKYSLVQHLDVISLVANTFRDLQIETKSLEVQLKITEYGERMALYVPFPDSSDYSFKIGNGDKMALRFECFNSVDRSTRFTLNLSWMRLICSNGLMVRVSSEMMNKMHNEHFDYDALPEFLEVELKSALKSKKAYKNWIEHDINEDKLRSWVDGTLKQTWGVKAAARVFHIAKSGRDVTFPKPFEKGTPSSKTVTPGKLVPGAFIPAKNAFEVSQALAWVAGQYRELPEQLDKKQQINNLIDDLMEVRKASTAQGLLL